MEENSMPLAATTSTAWRDSVALAQRHGTDDFAGGLASEIARLSLVG
ncbi:hypothetical protein [Cupriavidus pinatubonensis]|nr:hypothetical protein [Cupriavidus pinatubonensis]